MGARKQGTDAIYGGGAARMALITSVAATREEISLQRERLVSLQAPAGMIPLAKNGVKMWPNLDWIEAFMGRGPRGAETMRNEVWEGWRALARNWAQARSR